MTTQTNESEFDRHEDTTGVGYTSKMEKATALPLPDLEVLQPLVPEGRDMYCEMGHQSFVWNYIVKYGPIPPTKTFPRT